MATILHVKELLAGETGTIDRDRKSTFQRLYLVESDARLWPQEAWVAEDPDTGVQVPFLYETFPGSASYCVSKTTSRPAEDDKLIQVACTFEPIERDREKHPLSRRPVIQRDSDSEDEVVERDIDGQAILNSAGQAYDPPLIRERNSTVVRITRNEALFPSDLAETYENAINSDTWQGRPPYTVLCKRITGQSVTENVGPEGSETELEFQQVTYEFKLLRADNAIHEKTFREFVLDQGRYINADGILVPIRDRDGEHVVDPVLLDGAGQKLEADADPVFREHRVLRELPFSDVFSF